MTHSIPDASGVALTCELGTVLVTGDYKFDQTPGLARRARTSARLAQLGEDGPAAAVRRLDQRRPRRLVDQRGRRRPAAREGHRAGRRPRSSSRASPRTSTACSRSSTPPHALDRRVALVGRSMRKYVNIARSLGHIEVPDGLLVQPREMDTFPDEKLVDHVDRVAGRAGLGAAPHGPQRPPGRRAARGRHRRLQRDADPRQRARDQRDDRPPVPHRLHASSPRATRRSTPPATATPRRSSSWSA